MLAKKKMGEENINEAQKVQVFGSKKKTTLENLGPWLFRAPGCLGYIRDEILPNYIGFIINYYPPEV